MAQTSPHQRKTTGRIMHEFAHGELRSGPGGEGGKVKSRPQAIAIALKEAGASKHESPADNRRNLAKTEGKEARKAQGRDVFVYFDNDQKAAAQADGRRLVALLTG
jgi:hypothetical protein